MTEPEDPASGDPTPSEPSDAAPKPPLPASIPAKPALSPRELKRETARQARLAELEEKRLAAEAERAERAELEARGEIFHGHRVIDGEALDEVFEEPTPEQIKLRHRITRRVILIVLSAIVLIALVLAFLVWTNAIKFPQASQSSSSTSTVVDPNCPTDTFDYQDNIGISVSIYNATSRPGLAGSLATDLKARGYQVINIGDREMISANPGVIVSGLMGQAAAFNLQRNLPGMEYRKDSRADASVDIYLLGSYQAPAPVESVDMSPGKIVCFANSATSAGTP